MPFRNPIAGAAEAQSIEPRLFDKLEDKAGYVVLPPAFLGCVNQLLARLLAGRRLANDIQDSLVGDMPRETIGGQQQGIFRSRDEIA